MQQQKSLLIVPAEVNAEVIACEEGLSFWGGVDPDTGTVIDAHHDLHGQSLAGKIVLMPTSRGSCSGSGVLLQLALNGRAPAALIFREDEEVLTLGAVIASHMFDRTVGVARLAASNYDNLRSRKSARLQGNMLAAEQFSIDLHRVTQTDLELTPADKAMLAGDQGRSVALAMEVICAMAASQGAERLIDVTRGHIDGCIYAHDANLIFAETMARMEAKVAIPTTINAISVDRENWTDHGVSPKFGQAASRLADAYVRMGARPTFTCAPYLADDVPQLGESIGWSESNAVIFANSVLGARTAKHPDYVDLFIALTGRAPETGVYLSGNRRPRMVIDVDPPAGYDDALWPLLGWISGHLAPDRVPVLRGLEKAAPSRDDLRALCAAFGTTSAAALLHVAGVTPEGDLDPVSDAATARITRTDLAAAWRELNSGSSSVDLIALGSPHFSFEETRSFANLMAGKQKHPDISVIITLGRDVMARAQSEGLVDQLQSAGVQFYSDLCWCSIVEPMFPTKAKTLMTNSGKYAHYAPGLSGREVRFGSLSDCAKAAVTGNAPTDPPGWVL
ncbi:cis-3-hydroxy-L-proline dehydratase [Litoreibacter arenae]|uniref:2-Methylcitrate dehydratase AcnD n=1 Tax=Litoreibacter arenae DSM 19593 TaxID=1123360 RepID=S9RW39_9RHOB|nr:aconitase X [Litoreibacter arenae]EPX78214.1 2-Methylcitrate dehydratase AcnD [Litoreibacter arenae DSM 19593]